MLKNKKAFIFYFLMCLILLDFGNQIRRISFIDYIQNIDNAIFSIHHAQNTGIAFSLFLNHANILAYFGFGVVLAIAYYIYRYVKFDEKIILLSLTLFSAGVLGNAIERLRFGFVADFIKLNFIDFPIFNAFDVMICTGCALYIIFLLIAPKDLDSNENKN